MFLSYCRDKYCHLDSSGFKKLPAFLHVDDNLNLVENVQMDRLIEDEIGEGDIDSDEELANDKVDMSLGPRTFISIEEMIEFNKKRAILIAETLESIRKSKQGTKAKFEYVKPDGKNPDCSQMFNMISVSNPSLVRVQNEFRAYLEVCLKTARKVRQIILESQPEKID